jgi:hypothetical protein
MVKWFRACNIAQQKSLKVTGKGLKSLSRRFEELHIGCDEKRAKCEQVRGVMVQSNLIPMTIPSVLLHFAELSRVQLQPSEFFFFFF